MSVSEFVGIAVSIRRFVAADPQPGVVEAELRDVNGDLHLFIEKWPVFSTELLDERSRYPRDGVVRGRVLKENGLSVTVDLSRPDGVEFAKGQFTFEVDRSTLEP